MTNLSKMPTCHAVSLMKIVIKTTITDKLQRVMNAAVRVVSGTWRYNHGLRQLCHAELHWLNVADRVTFKLCMTVSSQSRPGLPVRAVYAGCPSRRTTAPSFGQLPSTRRAKNTARYIWPSCVRYDWSNHLEHTEQWPAWSRTRHRQLRSPIEEALVSVVFGALSASEALCDNALYKLTLTIKTRGKT